MIHFHITNHAIERLAQRIGYVSDVKEFMKSFCDVDSDILDLIKTTTEIVKGTTYLYTTLPSKRIVVACCKKYQFNTKKGVRTDYAVRTFLVFPSV